MNKNKKNVRKKPKHEILAAIHETASGLYETGVIDRKAMHTFDIACAHGRLRTLSESSLFKDLKDQKFAAEYLTMCLEEGVGPFLRGLGNLLKTRDMNSKYFSPNLKGQDIPLSIVLKMLKKVGLRIHFRAKDY